MASLEKEIKKACRKTRNYSIEGKFCDACLVSSDKHIIPVHRVVLSIGSSYFRNEFESLENTQLRVPVPKEILLIIIEFLYKKETTFHRVLIGDVCKAAATLKIRGIQRKNITYLSSVPDNLEKVSLKCPRPKNLVINPFAKKIVKMSKSLQDDTFPTGTGSREIDELPVFIDLTVDDSSFCKKSKSKKNLKKCHILEEPSSISAEYDAKSEDLLSQLPLTSQETLKINKNSLNKPRLKQNKETGEKNKKIQQACKINKFKDLLSKQSKSTAFFEVADNLFSKPSTSKKTFKQALHSNKTNILLNETSALKRTHTLILNSLDGPLTSKHKPKMNNPLTSKRALVKTDSSDESQSSEEIDDRSDDFLCVLCMKKFRTIKPHIKRHKQVIKYRRSRCPTCSKMYFLKQMMPSCNHF